MCGRFTLAVDAAELEAAFALASQVRLEPRYNIAPTQPVPAVRLGPGGRELAELRWGLIPRWADDSKIGHRLINARAESVAEKPAFRDAFRHRRCVVPATGFYEWRKEGKRKLPYLVRRRDGAVFGIAGLWERWRGPTGPVESCTLLTRPAAGPVAQLHDRMPVALRPDELGPWLDPAADPDGASLALPFDTDAWEAVPVNPAVNDPKHEGADCIEPFDADAGPPSSR
ncbi:SOS response-associated peptidase [Vulgatibacter sp.]|uniref:SOS response-associated peptidase n=1 Tax=Vulgatibacter sp. TaxID=1971226 RepID=UPI003565A872